MRNFYKYPYYRGSVPPTPKPTPEHIPETPLPPPPIHRHPGPPQKPPPPKKSKKNKFDFKCFKNDTCKSLNDVEHFLCNFNDFIKYVKLINLLKK